jgi:hypothetical protein
VLSRAAPRGRARIETKREGLGMTAKQVARPLGVARRLKQTTLRYAHIDTGSRGPSGSRAD